MNQPPLDSANYNYPPQQRYEQPGMNGKSIAAMVLGIVSIILPYVGLIIGIVAIVFASLSLKEIRQTAEQGRGMATAGLVCGIIGTIIWSLVLLIIVIVLIFASTSDPYVNV